MINRRALIWGSLAAAGLAGCGPAAPQYRDSLADLSKTRAADVPPDVPVKAGPTVAWTLGSNVESYVKYSDDGAKYAASVGASKRLLADSDPQNLVDGGVAILRRHYPGIKPVESLAAAARQRYATTFVLDIQMKWGTWPGDDIVADLTLIAFDAQQQAISRIMSRGTSKIQAYVTPNPKAAFDMAIAGLNAKAEQLLS